MPQPNLEKQSTNKFVRSDFKDKSKLFCVRMFETKRKKKLKTPNFDVFLDGTR